MLLGWRGIDFVSFFVQGERGEALESRRADRPDRMRLSQRCIRMRLVRFVPLLLLVVPTLAFCQDYIAEAEECIAANSGAGSTDCLQRLYYESNLEIRRLEDRIVAQSGKREQDGTITGAHHEQAASSMRDAARRFKKFSERQCSFEVGYAGAAASGARQVFFRCLLRFNEERKAYLDGVTKKL